MGEGDGHNQAIREGAGEKRNGERERETQKEGKDDNRRVRRERR